MSEDFLNQVRLQKENIELCSEIYNQSLSNLSCWVQALKNTLWNCGMPDPDERIELNHEIYREANLNQFIIENETWLVDEQNNFYYCILNRIENDKGLKLFIELQVVLIKLC